jgi:hypothetical protein
MVEPRIGVDIELETLLTRRLTPGPFRRKPEIEIL